MNDVSKFADDLGARLGARCIGIIVTPLHIDFTLDPGQEDHKPFYLAFHSLFLSRGEYTYQLMHRPPVEVVRVMKREVVVIE